MDALKGIRIAFAALALAGVAGCEAEVYSKIPEREANEMIAVLERNGIAATRTGGKDGNFSIRVDSSKVGRATEILVAQGLPHERFETLGGVFENNHMVATPFEERARFMYALDQELANSLSRIAGVASARVHVMLPESSPLDADKAKPRASVFLYFNAESEVRDLVPVVKSLVVNAVSGLAYEDVTVALLPASRAAAEEGISSGRPFSMSNFMLAALALAAGLFALSRIRAPARKATR